ncbi:MAG: CapA family protein [Bacteroidales bacterium]|nr:CapA family protein [Bacteroidales bacterium]
MVKISFLGDIALVGKYNNLYQNNINPFIEIESLLKKGHYVIGNLECLSEGNEGENLKKKPRLKTNKVTLNYLNNLNIGLATLAHNHVYDNLLDGFNKTINFLDANNISHIGASTSKETVRVPLVKKIDDLNFCFLNYVTEDTNPNIPDDAPIFLNYFDITKIKNDIKKYRQKVDYVIVLLHWGGRLEGGNYPDSDQPEIAKKIIDMGANLIVGHHSHTLQPLDIYKGKYIFYSLGNFCFSDFESDNILHKLDLKRRTKSMILNIQFYKDNYQVDFDFIKNNNLNIRIDNTISIEYKKRNRNFQYLKKYNLLWLLYYFKVRYYYRILKKIYNRKKI